MLACGLQAGRERVTFSHCVPTILSLLLAAPYAAQADSSPGEVLVRVPRLTQGYLNNREA